MNMNPWQGTNSEQNWAGHRWVDYSSLALQPWRLITQLCLLLFKRLLDEVNFITSVFHVWSRLNQHIPVYYFAWQIKLKLALTTEAQTGLHLTCFLLKTFPGPLASGLPSSLCSDISSWVVCSDYMHETKQGRSEIKVLIKARAFRVNGKWSHGAPRDGWKGLLKIWGRSQPEAARRPKLKGSLKEERGKWEARGAKSQEAKRPRDWVAKVAEL